MRKYQRAAWLTLSSALFALAPKCPVCFLAYFGIFGVASLVRSQVSAPVAAAVAWAMAIHPSYLAMTVLDNSAFSPWMAAFGLLCIAAAAYLKTPSPHTAFWVGVTVGFGVWARANYTWMIAALCAALVISAWRRLLTLPISHWAWATIGGLVGGFPFLWYQVLSHGGTWEAVGMFPASGSLFQRLQERVRMLAEAVLADGERRAIWDGPNLPSWQLWLRPSSLRQPTFASPATSRPSLPAVTAPELSAFSSWRHLPV